MPTLSELAHWLSRTLEEPHTVIRPAEGQMARLALALDPADLPDTPDTDALFLHRSRGVGQRWPGLGVLGAHDGFDLHLTTGPNGRLARRLDWQNVERVEWTRASGLIATPPQPDWAAFHAALRAELGGEDRSFAPAQAGPQAGPLRVALMNALRPDLVQVAADAGVTVYLTGQVRPSALGALRERGLGLVALGHRRSELWGLRALATELEAAFPGLQTDVYGG